MRTTPARAIVFPLAAPTTLPLTSPVPRLATLFAGLMALLWLGGCAATPKPGVPGGGGEIPAGEIPADEIPAEHRLVLAGWRHQGHPEENEYLDELGWALAVGDLDGDGLADIVAGVPGETLPTRTQVGEVRAFVSNGAAAEVGAWQAASSRRVWQERDPAWLKSSWRSQGRAVLVVDADGDGRGEVCLGAPGWDEPANSGRVGWLRGVTPTSDDSALGPIEPARGLYGAHGGSWEASARISAKNLGPWDHMKQSQLGWALAAGDFDGDGHPEVALAAPRLPLSSTNTVTADDHSGVRAGGVFVLRADALPRGTTSRVVAQGTSGDGNEHEDRFGWALAVGDFDGNGVDDLAVGAPYDNDERRGAADAGKVFVFYGRKTGEAGGGLAAAPGVVLDPGAAGGDEQALAGALFGRALAAGDLDGDGADELMVGAPLLREGDSRSARVGAVFVFRGAKGGGLAAGRSTVLREPGGRGRQGDQFGHALAVGRLDADGLDDLIVGAPLVEGAGGARDSGAVFVYRGGAGGVGEVRAQRLELGGGGRGARPGDRFGWALATGDVDGDGLDELVASAPYRQLQPPDVPADEPGIARDAGVITVWEVVR